MVVKEEIYNECEDLQGEEELQRSILEELLRNGYDFNKVRPSRGSLRRKRRTERLLKSGLTEDQKKKIQKDLYYDTLDVDNPFREDSDVDLSESKNDFRWIETEALKTLMKSGLSGSEWSVFFYILHRTRGYCNKLGYYTQTEVITIEEIKEYTGLTENTVYRVLGSLKHKQMIYTVKKGREVKTGVNFRYDTWNLLN